MKLNFKYKNTESLLITNNLLTYLSLHLKFISHFSDIRLLDIFYYENFNSYKNSNVGFTVYVLNVPTLNVYLILFIRDSLKIENNVQKTNINSLTELFYNAS
jgi:hypothetical protein